MLFRLCGFSGVPAPCLAVSWTSTLEVLTWPSLTMRTRWLRVKPTTSVDNGPTTSSTQVTPSSLPVPDHQRLYHALHDHADPGGPYISVHPTVRDLHCEGHHMPRPWFWFCAPDCLLCLGHLHLKGSAEKMSKSLKNFVTIKVKPSPMMHHCSIVVREPDPVCV